MTRSTEAPSPRRSELLELAYAYALRNGLVGMSLRPLAEAVGSSPRVLLFLFGSKDDLVRALLARARDDERALLGELRGTGETLAEAATRLWAWLSDPRHRGLLALWAEAYGHSLVDPSGAWSGFAAQTVHDWLGLLATVQPPAGRRTRRAAAERTAVLAILRGALLDLLATGDVERTTQAVRLQLAAL